MLPVVAIVGRPNVGKSTLFNCLTSSRAALVSDLPGMTRDRQYGEAHIAHHRFIVIDTGGIIRTKNDLDQLTTAQAFQAIQEADKILFVVDARAGITADDQLIAEQLRCLKKPLFLVANKTESMDLTFAIADLYKFGFGEPYPISAAHKSGINELVNILFTNNEEPLNANKETDRSIKLALVGRPNVGKSTLTNRMLGEDRVIVFNQPGTTRDSIFIPLERENVRYTLIDTAGLRRRGKVFEATEKFSVVKTLQAIQTANVVLFVMDAREGATDQDLRLLGFILESGKSLVIAINKWDGMTIQERDKARSSIDRRLNFVSFARIHTISALHGSGVGNLFSSINEAYTSATQKLSTPQLTKILRTAVMTHMPPLINGRRIKLSYAHAGGHNPPLIIIHGNQVKSLPSSYTRYLANTFQSRLKLIGTPIQIEFKSGENPYRDKKNVLTEKQRRKKMRLIRHTKR
ncbi:MAG: der [Gammaproteobacteria bacterium]|jgi:GTP-binding protein|nr:der [Gammaproteobacteria bacterium]